MRKPSLVRFQLAALLAQLKSSVRLIALIGIILLGLLILTLIPLNVVLWKLACS